MSGSFSAGRKSVAPPNQGPVRTCGHWPAPFAAVNENGEKIRVCANCNQERTATP
jgi:hypothetical protein